MSASLKIPFSIIRHSYAFRYNAITRTLRSLSSIALQRPSLHSRCHRYARHFSVSVDEEASARLAASSSESGVPTIGGQPVTFLIHGSPFSFDKIISKEVPSSIVYEDEKVLAFRDINPQAPIHILVIPKVRDVLTQLGKAQTRHTEILGHLLYVAKVVAEKEGIVEGFRIVINNGPTACQSVYHLHLHVLGGRQLKWPPG